MEEEKIEMIILLESIKENIKHNPGKGIWAGIVICNSKEYHWKIIEKSLDFLAKDEE